MDRGHDYEITVLHAVIVGLTTVHLLNAEPAVRRRAVEMALDDFSISSFDGIRLKLRVKRGPGTQ